MTGNEMVIGLVVVYLVIGVGVAGWLGRLGHPPATAMSAVVAWPLMWSTTGTAASGVAPGPHHARIAACFEALTRTLREEPAAVGLVGSGDLSVLRHSLERADARIAAVDRLLAEPGLRDEPGARALQEARAKAADQVEAVLAGVLQLRVQVGLLALAGDTAGVRARLGELTARVRALEEIEGPVGS